MSLKHQLTKNVKLLQKVAIIRQNGANLEVLLLQRSDKAKYRPGCWDLPGGNSEWPNEGQDSIANLHLKDLTREIKEETSLSILNNAFVLKLPVHFSTYFDSDKQIYSVICGWMLDHALTDAAEIKISDEHKDFAWVSGINLIDYDFGGDKGTFILDTIQKAFIAFKNSRH